MGRAVLVECLQPSAGETETGRLDSILMGDDDHVAMGVLLVQFAGDRRHPLRNFGDLLGDEVESRRVVQVSLELTGEP
jgi:hypothetical protein